eukprot:jgi/Tetstr1/441520/TSEL_029750.t1
MASTISTEATVAERQLWVAGGWVAPARGGRLPVVDPATEEVVGSIPTAGAEDVDAAVAAANAAFASGVWSRTTGAHRATILRAIADKARLCLSSITAAQSSLARLETIDCGKPIAEAEWDMEDVAGCFQYYADLAEKLDTQQGRPVALPMEEFKGHQLKEPLGTVALITPWNYPLLMATWKVAPALAAGCSCVLKPSELASLTCLELGRIAGEAGLPGGVLNIVTGLGAEAGAALASHPDVTKVAFTGSTATGRSVALAAAQNLRPTSLELGGKSPLVIFEDADVDAAVEWAMFGAFWTNGQICTATSRVLVASSLAPAFYCRLKARAEAIKLCHPQQADCRLGPLVSAAQYKKVMAYVQGASREGATLLTGGQRPPHMPRGYYVQPTVFTGVRPDMTIWREEVFGPVLACATFETEDEAIRLANDSVYGLAAAVISKDEARCQRLTSAMRCGIVWVNCSQPCFVQSSWGGVKRSGYGRDLGEAGLEKYLSLKSVTTYVSRNLWDWYPQPGKPASKL